MLHHPRRADTASRSPHMTVTTRRDITTYVSLCIMCVIYPRRADTASKSPHMTVTIRYDDAKPF